MKFTIHINVAGCVSNVNALLKFLSNHKPGDYWIEPTSTDKRTLPQNAWLHSILPEVLVRLRHIGYDDVKTTEDAKDVIKSLFFKKTFTNGLEFIEVIEGTSKTSKEVFTERAEAIIKWGIEYLGIDIAPPETQLEVWD